MRFVCFEERKCILAKVQNTSTNLKFSIERYDFEDVGNSSINHNQTSISLYLNVSIGRRQSGCFSVKKKDTYVQRHVKRKLSISAEVQHNNNNNNNNETENPFNIFKFQRRSNGQMPTRVFYVSNRRDRHSK